MFEGSSLYLKKNFNKACLKAVPYTEYLYIE